jgi:hypothetical protein
VPALSDGNGGLVFALEHHARSVPDGEVLEIAQGNIRHRDAEGNATQMPCLFAKLDAQAPTPSSLRLILRSPRPASRSVAASDWRSVRRWFQSSLPPWRRAALMPAHIRHLRAIRRRAWVLVALGLVGQIAGAALDPATQSGAATAAPIQEIANDHAPRRHCYARHADRRGIARFRPCGHHAAAHQAIAVTNAWARETAPAQVNGGGFLTITNKGKPTASSRLHPLWRPRSSSTR